MNTQRPDHQGFVQRTSFLTVVIAACVVLALIILGNHIYQSSIISKIQERLKYTDDPSLMEQREYSKASRGTLGIYSVLYLFHKGMADDFAEAIVGTSAKRGKKYEEQYKRELERVEQLEKEGY